MSGSRAARRVRVVAAVVHEGDRLLMTQRPPGGPLGLQWEFPGGKIEPGEDPAQALVREVSEELGVGCEVHEVLATECHDYPHLAVEIVFMRATLASRAFTPSAAVHAWHWLRPDEIDLEQVLEADREFLRGLGAGARSSRAARATAGGDET